MIQDVRLLCQSYHSSLMKSFKHNLNMWTGIDFKCAYGISKLVFRHGLTTVRASIRSVTMLIQTTH